MVIAAMFWSRLHPQCSGVHSYRRGALLPARSLDSLGRSLSLIVMDIPLLSNIQYNNGCVVGAPGAEARRLDVEQEGDQAALEAAVQEADAVISMMPPPLHPKAAALALKHGKHFLTTSYVSDAMRALEPLAKEKNVLMINECGVDPGTDHSPPPPPSSSFFFSSSIYYHLSCPDDHLDT